VILRSLIAKETTRSCIVVTIAGLMFGLGRIPSRNRWVWSDRPFSSYAGDISCRRIVSLEHCGQLAYGIFRIQSCPLAFRFAIVSRKSFLLSPAPVHWQIEQSGRIGPLAGQRRCVYHTKINNQSCSPKFSQSNLSVARDDRSLLSPKCQKAQGNGAF
jgi:hypothetical protein